MKSIQNLELCIKFVKYLTCLQLYQREIRREEILRRFIRYLSKCDLFEAYTENETDGGMDPYDQRW